MRRRRWLIGAGAVVAVLVLGCAWLLGTSSGARFAVARAQGLLEPRLAVGGVEGRLAGPLRVTDLRWVDPATGVDLTLARADVDVGLLSLLGGTAHVQSATLEGLRLALTPVDRPPPPDDGGDPLEPPIDLRVDAFTLRDARVISAGTELVHVREALLGARWTSAALEVQRLDVVADQGEVHFTARAARDGASPRVIDGEGNGRFEWRFGERTLAGTLQARSADALANLDLRLQSPLVATLALQLRQQDRLPWNWRLDVPAFDPSTELMPGSSLRQLAAALTGSGTLDEATTQGRIVLNDTPLEIRTLSARRQGEDVALQGELDFGGGEVRIDGALQPQAQPLSGRFDVQWQGIGIPADLVGQELRTEGRIGIGGSAQAYDANGMLKLGPPGRLADIQLDLTGSESAVQLARFDIVQPRGRLSAAGVVTLQPQLGWTVAAAARAFDPGAVLSEWPGRLDFRLASDGRVLDEGIEAQLVIRDLGGRLRDRAVAGTAGLQLEADRALTGNADLSSGASRVRIEGSRDAQGEARAEAVIDVADLGDWLPDAGGSAHGTVDARGIWPEVAVTARLTAANLAWNGQALRQAQLNVDVTRPLQPAGSATLDAQGLVAAGFEFDQLRLRASGDQARHEASFDASGPQLTLGADVSGASADQGWQGEVSRLQIAAVDIARLQLEQPFAVSTSPDGARLGRACLVDGEIRLCVEGESAAPPALHLRYELRAVPLRLARAFVELPVSIEGRIDGDGDVRRDAAGVLSGQAVVRSSTGRITELAAEGQEARELLAWRDLSLDAQVQGEDAQLVARAALNTQGSLDGRVSASGLSGADPQVQGTLAVKLPGLGVVEAFAPQVMNVQGSLSLDARFAGALRAPRIDGEARLAGLGFDLPQLNLKPREGEIVARLAGLGEPGGTPVSVTGSMKSGEGTLRFEGDGGLDGSLRLALRGTDVLAADIPGVRLTVTPDISVRRTAERTDVEGQLRIPSASVDLQRLPNAKRTRSASPDVVVIDDETADGAERSSPIHARVEVQLGEDVKMKGYGLDATVGGELDIRERPGEPTTASGELRVAGKYQAYGQDLTIQQGQLLYANTPIDNPRLAITAVRQVDTVTAGFRVSGNARTPELNVFSDPAMGQANALSYIVAGKPLDQIGTGTGEGDALQSAARQLGTAAGGLLAKNVGKRLGVDELGIKDSASIGGAALTVGQYLSPRLYIGYGVGLFQPGQVVTLRYRLSRELALEAEQGTLNSRAGIEFRKER